MIFDEEKKDNWKTNVYFRQREAAPGGQNVNKVNTRVEIRFSIDKSSVLAENQKERIHLKLNNRINSEGELLLISESERTQLRNKQKVVEKFFSLLEKALTIPKKRIKTKPSINSKLKRMENKKILSQKKQLRKPPDFK